MRWRSIQCIAWRMETKGENWARSQMVVFALRRASKKAREATELRLSQLERPSLPCEVTLVRCSNGELDDDNLRAAMKPIRDEVARWVGCDDKQGRGIRFRYAQLPAKQKQMAVLLLVSAAGDARHERTGSPERRRIIATEAREHEAAILRWVEKKEREI